MMMQVFTSLDQTTLQQKPSVLTFGNFDGVHLGHQSLLKKVKELSQSEKLNAAVVTFKNHPSTVLRPNHLTPLLTTPEHKLKLLSAFGIDIAFMLPFNADFADQTAEKFLQNLQKALPFRFLLLGYDQRFGKDRLGDRSSIMKFADKMHFFVDTIEPMVVDEKPISSSAIRRSIQEGNLRLASLLLGRPYSIYAPITLGRGQGKTLGFPTANIDASFLSVPPFGVYAVTVKINGELLKGVANIGFAPTLRSDHKPLLEVYLFDHHKDVYGQFAEVVFEEFIRPEKIFADSDALKEQIKKDIEAAIQILK